MPDPRGKDWNHLKSWMMQSTTYNGEVREYFSDVKEDDDFKTLPRAATRKACLIDSSDSALIALHKRLNFYFTVLKLHRREFSGGGGDSRPEGVRRKTRPKITLYFEAERDSLNRDPVTGEIGFRIMNETSETYSRSQANALATRIKSLFGGPNPYKWHKGKTYYTYTEWERGYQFQVLANSKDEAKTLINKVMDLQLHSPNWSYLNTVTNEEPSESFPANPGKVTILGESVFEPVLRPVVNVVFQYATLTLWPHKPVTLYDATGRRSNPLVS